MMADATAVFFDELARRGHDPLLGDAVGSVRFELVSGSHVETWRIGLDNGDVSVSRDDDGGADCVVRCEKQLFDGIATGEVNAMAALLRGALAFQGDPELLVRLQRAFPPPPADRLAARGADRR
jgi:putative sterol carrier protein